MIYSLANSIVLLLASAAPLGAPSPQPRLLVGAKILDSECRSLLDNRQVLVNQGRIVGIFTANEEAARAARAISARRLDLRGLVLIPGLIDLHSHLLLHPYDEASWDDQVLREPLELRTIRAVVAARRTLMAGFTTLRDLGTEGAGYADVSLREAISQGIIPGPRIFAVTRAIVATGCYGPSGFDPRWRMPKGAQVADGVAGVRRVVREQIAAGADWIKVYGDYRRRRGGPATPTFSQEELNALVHEANSAGLPVSAHATTDEAIRRAVLAGVATIEHGTNASEKTLRLMREHGVVLCPTLAASEAMARYGGWKQGDPEHPRIRESRAMFARALASEVTIACGSDVGVFSHGENVRELELMAEYGMTPADVLRSATITAAKVIGRQRDLGRIADDYLADLVAVRGNPLENPSVLRHPIVVMKEGVIAIDRRGN